MTASRYPVSGLSSLDIYTGTGSLIRLKPSISETAIDDFTTIDLTSQTDLEGTSTNSAHTSINHPGAPFMRFKITENNIAADVINLYVIIMTESK